VRDAREWYFGAYSVNDEEGSFELLHPRHWQSFLKDFRKRWISPTARMQLHQDLNLLRVKLDKGVPQWAEFNSLFRKLVLRLGFEKFAEATALEEIYRIYLRQVPETHRAMITGHALLGGKEPTLGMVMEYMKKVQGDTIQSVMAKIFVKPSIANTPIVPTTEPLTTSEGGDAMDLSVVQSRPVHSVSCFYCKKLGHVVRNCRLKTQDLDAEKRRKHYAENANAKRNVYEGKEGVTEISNRS
jgi:hypothetical protein